MADAKNTDPVPFFRVDRTYLAKCSTCGESKTFYTSQGANLFRYDHEGHDVTIEAPSDASKPEELDQKAAEEAKTPTVASRVNTDLKVTPPEATPRTLSARSEKRARGPAQKAEVDTGPASEPVMVANTGQQISPARPVPQTVQQEAAGEEISKTRLTNLGFQGLEVVLGGGLPENSVFLLTGVTGTHYVTFAHQAIYNHLLSGGKAIYYSPDKPSSDILEDMRIYGWKLQRYIDEGSLVFCRPLPPQIQMLADAVLEDPMVEVVKLGSSPTLLLKDFVNRLKEDRWSILNLSYMMIAYPFNEIVDLMMYWVNAVHKCGGVHFILLPDGAYDEKQVTLLENMVDGVLVFKFAQGFLQLEGEVVVKKIRKVLLKSNGFKHTIQSDGLVIENATRIG